MRGDARGPEGTHKGCACISGATVQRNSWLSGVWNATRTIGPHLGRSCISHVGITGCDVDMGGGEPPQPTATSQPENPEIPPHAKPRTHARIDPTTAPVEAPSRRILMPNTTSPPLQQLRNDINTIFPTPHANLETMQETRDPLPQNQRDTFPLTRHRTRLRPTQTSPRGTT